MWYDVKIQGRHNGNLRLIDVTVKALNPEAAVRLALAGAFDVEFSGDIGWEHPEMDGYPGPRPLVFNLGERGRLVTAHEQLSDVVAEADPVRVARIIGAPELPLSSNEPATALAPVAQRWFAVNLDGVTANGRPVRHHSTHRTDTAERALIWALEEVLDLRPDSGRQLKFYPVSFPPVGENELLALELVGVGVTWPLAVKGRTLWDIVTEVEPPSWASRSVAPDAYQQQVLATWGSVGDTIGQQRLHALLGLVGEAGEVANLVKKQLYKPGVVADGAAVIDELADVAYYLAMLASLYGVTFDGLFAHLAGKLAGGHGWVTPSNSTGLEGGDHA